MTDRTSNHYNTGAAFVAADPVTVEPVTMDLVKRQDVVDVVDRMIDGYMTQQRVLLDQVQGETTRGGFLSDADQVMERRKTTRLYLFTYGMVNALTTGGLAYMGYLAGIDAAVALGAWMAATGGLTLLLAHRAHAKEFDHSPEGIARHVIEAHWDIASYEAETRRKAIEWEHNAEQRRQDAADRQASHARQLAKLRIAEVDARRLANDALRERTERQFSIVMQAETAQERVHDPSVSARQQAAPEPREDACIQVTAGSSWQAALTHWLASLYGPGKLTANGVIRGQTPWAARSSWVEADKANARRVCCEMYPKLVEPSDGGRWRLRIEMFPDADIALRILSQRL